MKSAPQGGASVCRRCLWLYGGPRKHGPCDHVFANGGDPQCGASVNVGDMGVPHPRSGSSVRVGPYGGRQGLGIIGHPWDPYRGPGSSIEDSWLAANVLNPWEVAKVEQQIREARLLLGPFQPDQPPPDRHVVEHKEEPKEIKRSVKEEPKEDHPWRRSLRIFGCTWKKCQFGCQGTHKEGPQNQ